MAVSRLSTQSIQQAFPKGNTVWDGTTSTSSYDSLGTFVLSSAASSITFSNIPQTYTHLQIRCVARSAGTSNGLWVQFNGDATTANYTGHYLLGDGAGASSGVLASTPIISYFPTNAASAGIFGTTVIDILDYTTTKPKTLRSIGGWDSNGSGYAWFGSEFWSSASAVTSITMLMASSNSIDVNSTFALYGVK